jgi:hypothetical protein
MLPFKKTSGFMIRTLASSKICRRHKFLRFRQPDIRRQIFWDEPWSPCGICFRHLLDRAVNLSDSIRTVGSYIDAVLLGGCVLWGGNNASNVVYFLPVVVVFSSFVDQREWKICRRLHVSFSACLWWDLFLTLLQCNCARIVYNARQFYSSLTWNKFVKFDW